MIYFWIVLGLNIVHITANHQMQTHSSSRRDFQTRNCTCGKVNTQIDYLLSSKVIGGQLASQNEWPMMVGLLLKKTRLHFCGGTIVSSKIVLTAAHCLHINGDKIPIDAYGVVFGFNNLDRVKYDDLKSPRKAIVHPKYAWPLSYDIAVLVMKEITLSEIVGPACLFNGNFNEVGKILDHTGWGVTSANGQGSKKLKKAKLRGIDLRVCEGLYNRFGRIVDGSQRYQMCTNKINGNQCKGDSGGPVFWMDPDTYKYYLVGIISFGYPSCNAPSVNTAVTYFISWIAKIAEETSKN